MFENIGMRPILRWFFLLFVLVLTSAMASQASAQPTFNKSFSPATIAEGSVSTLTFRIGNADTDAVTDLAFSDTLPAGVSVADAPGIGNTCDGTVSATAGGNLITLTDGILSGSSSCTIVVYVTSSAAGIHTNKTGTLTSSAGDSGTATADLIVNARYPHFSISFSPRSIYKGGRTTLTFNIDTMGISKGILSSTFTDTLPAGLELAYPTNLVNTCPGSFTIGELLGAVSLSYVNNPSSFLPTMDVDETCSISLDLTADLPGLYTNLSGNFSGSLTNASYQIELFDSGKAASDVDVSMTPLSIWKDFPDDPAGPDDTTVLTFTIMNSNRASATNITFTDDLDDMLTGLAANDTPLTDPCGSGSSLTGTDTLILNNGHLESAESCTFSVNLLIPTNAPVGGYLNTTTAVTADIDGNPVTGNAASEYLFIQPAPKLVKAFDPATVIAGDTVDIDFTITNASSTDTVSGISFTDEIAVGFDPISTSAGDCTGASFVIVSDEAGDPRGVSFSEGSLAPNASCTATLTLNLASLLASGVYDNTTSYINGTVSGVTYQGHPASASLTVYGAPLLTKSFTDDPVVPGDPVTLEFTVTNRDAVNPVSNISFTDDLDAALSGLTASSSTQNDICGLGSSISGTSLLTFSNGSLGAGESCSFSVTVDTPGGATSGTYTNTTSSITAGTGGHAVTGGAATGDLRIGELSMTTAFTDDPALPAGTVNLRFVITNSSSTSTFTDITFQDSLKDTLDGLAPSSTATLTDICNTGDKLTWTSGSTTGYLKFTGGSLGPSESCTIDVPLDIPSDAATGSYLNRTTNFVGKIGTTSYSFANSADNLEINGNLLEITKTFADDLLPPDGASTLVFTITNLDSTRTITDITFTDDLEAAMSGLEATGLPASDVCGAGSQISGTGLLTLTGGSLAAGADCTITVDIHVPSSAIGGTTAVNTTSAVTGAIGASTVTGPAATDGLTINDVVFTKSFGGPALQAGTTSLSFYIENKNATGRLDSLTFSDDLDSALSGLAATDTPLTAVCGPDSSITGTSTLILNKGYLDPGDSCTFEVTVLAPFPGAAGNYTNTTSALINNTTIVAEAASDTLTVQTRYYTISGTLTDSGTSLPIPGALVSFSHDNSSVTTDSKGTYTKSVALGTNTTVTPSKTGYAGWSPASQTFNSLDGDKTQNFSSTLETFTISGQVTDGADPIQDVTLTFSHDSGTTRTDASGNYSYTVDYGVTTTVTPSKTGCHSWSPPSATFSSITGNETRNFEGVVQTFTITGQVTHDSDPLEGVTLTFSHDGGTTPSDATGNYSYTVDYGANTTVTPGKTGYTGWAPSGRTLTNVTSDQSGQDFAGRLEIHELTVLKNGEGEGAVTSNPAGIDCGSTCTALYDYGTTVTLTAAPDPGDFWEGWSGGGCSGAGDCQVLMEAEQTVTATFNPVPSSDLAVAKETNTYNPGLGGHITFIIRVTNNGPDDTTGVVVTDVLPAGVTYESDNSGGSYNASTGAWTVGNLADGETVDLMISAFYDTEAVVTNTARISHSATYDPNPDNDAASVTIDAQADIADLSVWKLGVPKLVETGDDLVYFITVGNIGPASAVNVELTDVIPSDITGVQYKISGSGTGYASWPAGNVVSLATLDPSGSKTVWVRGQVSGTPADGILANTAQVTSDTPDSVAGNSGMKDDIRVLASVPACDLSVVKSIDPETAVPGDTLVVTITGANNGPDVADNVSVLDLLHHGLTYVNDDSSGDYHPRTGTWSVGSLANSESATLNITAEVNAGGVIDNTASISASDGLDTNLANNSSSVAVNGSGGPDLGLWAQLNGPSPSGVDGIDRFTYVLHFANNGVTSSSGVQVRVTLPAGVDLIGAAAGNGCYDPTANIWHVDDALACDDSLENLADTVRYGIGSTLTLTLDVTDYGSVGAGYVTSEIIEPPADPDITNNAVTRALYPEGELLVDLSVKAAVSTSTLKGGQTAVITATVRNNGPDAASSVRVLNQIPSELTLVSAHPFQGIYRSDSGIWLVGNLAAGAGAILELTVTPAANVESATFNTEVSGVAETELNTGNNRRQVEIKVQKSSGHGDANDGGCFLDHLLCR